MVKLTKIYTKVGDTGETMLGDGSRVPKTSARVEAYGTVDEANASIGLAIASIGDGSSDLAMAQWRDELTRIQNDLFDVGADLCKPMLPGEKPGSSLRIEGDQVTRLERLIDGINESLSPLNSFVLPGGTELASRLHLARTIVRRAERCVAALLESRPVETNPQTLVYLNRLSDLLFVMARAANHQGGAGDVLWRPGANR